MLLAVVALVGGLRGAASPSPASRGLGFGLMAGAFSPYGTALYVLARAGAELTRSRPWAAAAGASWVAAAQIIGFGFWLGWLGFAVGAAPLGDPRTLPGRVDDWRKGVARPLTIAGLLVGGPVAARGVSGTLGTVTDAGAALLGWGLQAGNTAANRVWRMLRSGSEL